MKFKQLVDERRSVRAYVDEIVNEEDIRSIVDCLLQAPSWKNSQTGRYYVALSDEAKREVFDSLPEYNQNSSRNASYIICAYKTGESGANSSEGDLWGSYDLGLQNAYLVLKACELNYDTLIMGLRNVERVRKYFEIPENECILPIIAIGKRAKDKNPRNGKEIDEVLRIK